MYVLDTERTSEGYGIWKWNEKKQNWTKVNGKALTITVGRDGKPYAINMQGEAFWPTESCLFPTRVKKPK
jgi:hypothetical protein